MTLSLVAGGRRLEYVWIGPAPEDAPTLVFLHEGLGSLAAWRDFPAAVASATGFGALVYSRAGYGGSDPAELPRPVRFMHDEAKVLGEVLDATGVRDAVLVGHSDGASIAIIHAGSEGGTRVRALVLEAPHVFTEPEGLASIARIADTYRTTDLPQRLAKYHGDNAEGAFWGWNRVWLDPEFRAWNIEEYLGLIRVPTLIIPGRGRRVRDDATGGGDRAATRRPRRDPRPLRLRPRTAPRPARTGAGGDSAFRPGPRRCTSRVVSRRGAETQGENREQPHTEGTEGNRKPQRENLHGCSRPIRLCVRSAVPLSSPASLRLCVSHVDALLPRLRASA